MMTTTMGDKLLTLETQFVTQPDESERGPRTPRQASPSNSSLSDEVPIEEGMEYTGICTDIAADCDQVIVKDNLGTSLGSFDTTFPFVFSY